MFYWRKVFKTELLGSCIKRKMDNTKKFVVTMLVIAILFSVLSIIAFVSLDESDLIPKSFRDALLNNQPGEDASSGNIAGGVGLLIELPGSG